MGTTSAAQQVTITNSGAVDLQISHITTSGDFAETNNCGPVLAASNACAVSVTYTPSAAGNSAGSLTITDDAPDSPQSVALNGTGIAAGVRLTVASGGTGSATVTAGQTATYMLAIGGAGVDGTATLSCSGAPTGANCSVPASAAVSATTASSVAVTVTTTSRTQGLAIWREAPRWYRGGFRTTPWSLLALIAILALWSAQISRRWTGQSRWRWVPLMALVACACGGGSSTTSNPNGTPAGSYTLTVTATVGGNSATQKLTLVVK